MKGLGPSISLACHGCIHCHVEKYRAQGDVGREVFCLEQSASCPVIPTVHVTLANGRTVRAVVERVDGDVARLEMLSADNFELYLPPPALNGAPHPDQLWIGDELCAQTARAEAECGTRFGFNVMEMRTRGGDSGAGVYDDGGRLIGIVVGGGKWSGSWFTRFAPIDSSWLEGT